MKNIKKIPLIFSILSILTFFTPANAEIKVVASIKPIHSLASYLMDGIAKPDLIVDGALTLTGVIHLKNKNLGNLSGGEFQRVLIARAISKKPELLVLDEPVQGVDYTGEIALYELIKRISDTLNCGILLISHDLHTVMTATDHVVCLNGHVSCSGSPMDVAKNNEYKTLFGEQASQILSVYEHKHDHVHSDKGEIKKN